YFNEWVTQRLAEAIVARPGWNVVIFPTIPLGVGGANEIGRKHVFPGTYAVRSTTLRAVFMDLGTELGEQGFRWVFIVHGHGAPNHKRMLDQAGDYFRDTYGGHMVHLMGLVSGSGLGASGSSEEEKKEDGFSVHAGTMETSALLFLRPDLVSPLVNQAPTQTGQNWDDLIRLARAPGWPGYFGSPRLATAARGAQGLGGAAKTAIEYALKILDGLDERQIPRLGDLASKNAANVGIDRDAIEREREIEKKQQAWLQKHKLQ
ncbi:MAG TPA: creatininase family protein, partial [Blastocatellia bacterium]|nr:creatininase family protein [Blastocatellia bacterium]